MCVRVQNKIAQKILPQTFFFHKFNCQCDCNRLSWSEVRLAHNTWVLFLNSKVEQNRKVVRSKITVHARVRFFFWTTGNVYRNFPRSKWYRGGKKTLLTDASKRLSATGDVSIKWLNAQTPGGSLSRVRDQGRCYHSDIHRIYIPHNRPLVSSVSRTTGSVWAPFVTHWVHAFHTCCIARSRARCYRCDRRFRMTRSWFDRRSYHRTHVTRRAFEIERSIDLSRRSSARSRERREQKKKKQKKMVLTVFPMSIFGGRLAVLVASSSLHLTRYHFFPSRKNRFVNLYPSPIVARSFSLFLSFSFVSQLLLQSGICIVRMREIRLGTSMMRRKRKRRMTAIPICLPHLWRTTCVVLFRFRVKMWFKTEKEGRGEKERAMRVYRSATRRKLRSGFCWLYENPRHCSMIESETRVYYVHRAKRLRSKRRKRDGVRGCRERRRKKKNGETQKRERERKKEKKGSERRRRKMNGAIAANGRGKMREFAGERCTERTRVRREHRKDEQRWTKGSEQAGRVWIRENGSRGREEEKERITDTKAVVVLTVAREGEGDTSCRALTGGGGFANHTEEKYGE